VVLNRGSARSRPLVNDCFGRITSRRFTLWGRESDWHSTILQNDKVVEYGLLFAQFLLLLLALKINRKILWLAPTLWIIFPILLSVALLKARYSGAEKIVVRLWQLVGLLSAVYSILHYPLMPQADGRLASVLYSTLIVAWVSSIVAGIFCFRIPSLSLLPPSFLIWSNSAAEHVTGLPVSVQIDVQPLTEVSLCIGLGLLISQLKSLLLMHGSLRAFHNRLAESTTNVQFANLLLLVAISVHLANYYWSFLAKIELDGPFGAWLTENNPAYIFLVALDDGHIFFSGYPRLVTLTYWFLNTFHFYTNLLVMLCQAATVVAFFLPKYMFVLLLLALDMMHVAIIFTVGANFWPWIILNVIITVIVVRPDVQRQPVALCLLASFFILVAPRFVQVQRLGWYDTGVNNKLFFEAVDSTGKRYVVPSNFFTFYSYAIGHMDYGNPAARGFSVGSPNGGTEDYNVFKASRTCDIEHLVNTKAEQWTPEKLVDFVRNYHRLALSIYVAIGGFPYNLYPHHFYVPPSESEGFSKLDKRQIVAYVYRQETVCLSFQSNVLRRKVVANAEYNIDVNGDE
jgi:hypothetical protein